MAYLAIGDIEHALKTMEAVAGDGDMFLAGVPSMPSTIRFAAIPASQPCSSASTLTLRV
jgi:hypothetical protein